MSKNKTAVESYSGWCFLPPSQRLPNGDWKMTQIGETLSVEGKVACFPNSRKNESGLRCCLKAIDSLAFVLPNPPAVIWRVEVWGDAVCYRDLVAGRNCRLLWYTPADKTIQVVIEWAQYCAKKAAEIKIGNSSEMDIAAFVGIDELKCWLNETKNGHVYQQLFVFANVRKAISCIGVAAERASRGLIVDAFLLIYDSMKLLEPLLDFDCSALLEQMLENNAVKA